MARIFKPSHVSYAEWCKHSIKPVSVNLQKQIKHGFEGNMQVYGLEVQADITLPDVNLMTNIF